MKSQRGHGMGMVGRKKGPNYHGLGLGMGMHDHEIIGGMMGEHDLLQPDKQIHQHFLQVLKFFKDDFDEADLN